MQKMKTKAFGRQDVGRTAAQAQRADVQREWGYGSPAARGAGQEGRATLGRYRVHGLG